MKPDKPLRPKNAATLIIIRHGASGPQVLMGRRHARSVFMPNKFVFPGGALERADFRLRPAAKLPPAVVAGLTSRVTAHAPRGLAQALGMAALRETFEETGLIIGQPASGAPETRSASWRRFLGEGYRPDLSDLRFFARAITPPGKRRRFDTRFFVINARHVVNPDHVSRGSAMAGDSGNDGELSAICWIPLSAVDRLDLAWITGDVLRRLKSALHPGGALTPGTPVSFQHRRYGRWCVETL